MPRIKRKNSIVDFNSKDAEDFLNSQDIDGEVHRVAKAILPSSDYKVEKSEGSKSRSVYNVLDPSDDAFFNEAQTGNLLRASRRKIT